MDTVDSEKLSECADGGSLSERTGGLSVGAGTGAVHDTSHLEQAAALLRTLGHPDRIAMVELLYQGSRCVCELAAMLGLNKSAASKHLTLLRNLGVVSVQRTGTQVMCSLAMPCVVDMLTCVLPPHSDKVLEKPACSCRGIMPSADRS